MINLRYHIVSVTAVFLALGIGVALGSSLIQRGLVDGLESRLDQQEERLDRTDGENVALRGQLATRDRFAQRLADEGSVVLAGHLADVPVVVLTVQGSDDDVVAETRANLRAAGAFLSGTLVFTARWEDLTDEEIRELSELVGRPLGSERVARTAALRGIADELRTAAGPPPEPEPDPDPEGGAIDGLDPDPDPAPGLAPGSGVTSGPAPAQDVVPQQVPPDGEDDLIEPDEGDDPLDLPPPVPESSFIASMIGLGYIEFFPESAGEPLPRFGTRYVFVADDEAVLDPDLVASPLLQVLMGNATAPVVVASAMIEGDAPEPTDATRVVSALVRAIRTSDQLGDRITTVDALGEFVGHAALVLGLVDLEEGIVGHYGVGPGAESLFPLGEP